jgi:predicted HicB family RNase H-like nuclease
VKYKKQVGVKRQLARVEITLSPEQKQAYKVAAETRGVSLASWIKEELARVSLEES